LFAFQQRKRRISSRVTDDDYEDVDEAEDSKSVYKGLYKLL